MAIGFTDLLWFLILVYPLVFLVFGFVYGGEYLRTTPDEDKGKDEGDDFDKQENIAYTLAGFAIAALSVIISFSNSDVANKEPLVDFFSIGFIAEIISGFLSHYRIQRSFKYFGFASQYTGLLAIISGFFAFFYQSDSNSPSLFLIYFVGILSFLLLTLPELYLYRKYWKALQDAAK